MTYVWLFCVFILYVLISSCAAHKPKCKKTLSLCKLTVGDGSSIDFPKQGLKGEKGDYGIRGEKGERGFIGESGYPGPPGVPGEEGPQGVAIVGDSGDTGPIGFKGIQGETGPRGENGVPGSRGIKGNKGSSGLIGLSGTPGSNGSCLCMSAKATIDDGDEIKTMCKDTPISESNSYYIDWEVTKDIIDSEPQVDCIRRADATSLTCVQPTESTKTYSFKNMSTGFWLSQQDLTLHKLYGFTRRVLTWMQKNSNSAIQTIRYHCYNSIPFQRDNVDKSLLLLTWNDNTIGPMPTSTKPFFYSVDYDGCSNNTKDTWSYTDIRLVSTSPRRVPIIDFFIREDVRNDITQEIKIEHKQLCFD